MIALWLVLILSAGIIIEDGDPTGVDMYGDGPDVVGYCELAPPGQDMVCTGTPIRIIIVDDGPPILEFP